MWQPGLSGPVFHSKEANTTLLLRRMRSSFSASMEAQMVGRPWRQMAEVSKEVKTQDSPRPPE
jgi:hypothetical protein